jgi:hypothetical protein
MEYILIEWPFSQELMDESWFSEEAILHPESSSAYFVPLKRVTTLRDFVIRYEQTISEIYGRYITEFMHKIKEYQGDSILLWKEHLLGNVNKDEFIKLIRTDISFSDKWGNLTPESRYFTLD